MPSELNTVGFRELDDDLTQMIRALSDEYGGEWKGKADSILNEAAQPVKDAMIRRIRRRTGKLQDAITIGRLERRASGGFTLKIGNQKDSDAFYARMVEFGHGAAKDKGGGAAGPHPFAEPAYNETEELVFAIIRGRLTEEINKIGR